ncbi:hypothetical protein O181_002648 [Austropuccinia psidii MF-1]|uniref:Uncharacterized protein n=1 Tax=Austropuccinia psidii MF-1 TaxID=1389203 RepID=A0A9Q3BCW7_9BASI|nr:hypothetical protein [Austropuccinia psidii MF-1]
MYLCDVIISNNIISSWLSESLSELKELMNCTDVSQRFRASSCERVVFCAQRDASPLNHQNSAQSIHPPYTYPSIHHIHIHPSLLSPLMADIAPREGMQGHNDEKSAKPLENSQVAGLSGHFPKTTTVRHRLPRRKVNDVWKPLSSESRNVLQEALENAMQGSPSTYSSMRRIEALTRQLSSNIRVPVGVFTGLKTTDQGEVNLLTLEALKKKNQELELLIKHRERKLNAFSQGSSHLRE